MTVLIRVAGRLSRVLYRSFSTKCNLLQNMNFYRTSSSTTESSMHSAMHICLPGSIVWRDRVCAVEVHDRQGSG
jgi:hypothetical protein